MNIKELIHGVIEEIVEGRIRETDITDGSRVPFGSKEHVVDLEMRISDLERWRDRQRRGSEARANYARLIGRLKGELRQASRAAEPNSVAGQPELSEADGDKKKKKKKQLTHVIPPTDMCGESVGMPMAAGGDWVVKNKIDGSTVGFPTPDREKAQVAADARNDVAMNGAWGKRNKHLGPPYEVVPHEPAPVTESVNMKDPEYASVEVFVQFLLDDERDTYTHEELTALNFRTRMPVNTIRKELEGYGLTLANRPNEKKVRGFSSNSNDRWFGPGSMATHGGAGIDPQTGRATSGRGDI